MRFVASPDIAHARRSSVGGLLLADHELAVDPLHVAVVGSRQDADREKAVRDRRRVIRASTNRSSGSTCMMPRLLARRSNTPTFPNPRPISAPTMPARRLSLTQPICSPCSTAKPRPGNGVSTVTK